MGVTVNNPNLSSSNSEAVKRLIARRDDLESELDALVDVLTSHNVDMKTPLVTPDGFPRDDIDVAQIRETRSRIIRLQNDLKGIMSKIEAGLVDYFKNAKDNDDTYGSNVTKSSGDSNRGSTSTGASTATVTNSSSEPPRDIPFALVNSLEANSPAESAGLEVGDQIISFGTVNASNHQNLARIATVVQSHEGKHIWVTVLRQGNKVIMPLIPSNTWGGRGSLGCHIIPL